MRSGSPAPPSSATSDSATTQDRLAAIATLKARGDEDAQSLIDQIAQKTTDPAVKSAAESALASIHTRLAMWRVAQNLWYGLSASSVLLLAAIGLAITFGVMGVINMAHGEMVMLGAYATYVVQIASAALAAELVARFRDPARLRRRRRSSASRSSVW